MPRLVVTGCARSGTQYTAQVLQNLGLRCGHEKVYLHSDELDFEKRWEDRDADISWLAAPYLNELPKDSVVLHLLRDPLKVVTCLVSHKLLTSDEQSTYFMRRHVKEISEGSDLERAVWYVLRWNQLIEGVDKKRIIYTRCRVEYLIPPSLGRVLRLAGINRDEQDIKKALGDVPTNAGACHSHQEVTWDDVLKTKAGEGLERMAKRYGYR